jgi:hypothetical protein
MIGTPIRNGTILRRRWSIAGRDVELYHLMGVQPRPFGLVRTRTRSGAVVVAWLRRWAIVTWPVGV